MGRIQHAGGAERLSSLEGVVRRGLGDAADALCQIREDRLYLLAGFDSFEAYALDTFGLRRSQAYALASGEKASKAKRSSEAPRLTAEEPPDEWGDPPIVEVRQPEPEPEPEPEPLTDHYGVALTGKLAEAFAAVAEIDRATAEVRRVAKLVAALPDGGGYALLDRQRLALVFRDAVEMLRSARPHCVIPKGASVSREVRSRGWMTKSQHDLLPHNLLPEDQRCHT